ncbi:hypothetical protein NEUTE1DRAFT_88097 [Neurospora tetrasperma FGSC 2508]|uniref:Arf-GAP domain-containing protein n=1 Tax=Neurospora tetrasperma (strain FGSC 2508 / ATCC MYA-4615 / P0657) TaxID=510951 RepID=F8MUX3_NEUT8|nr:uncharacterized protein NEUTE1DRAFT_88097 [Neurospora tetrasperma FGSC 2508]EGO54598.1 hypothetical protein NEUTE1DRAFT_88097 [Neurospora tetrasperma FGSC 2508]EGZ67948.1 ArfGap-domain-containing protein [Neurospora tetrasperma FGSC 2509]
MSRRPPNPAAERAAKNQQTIKSLLKLEANKVCADCKRNKHPRWASWNLGVFICIRCSGIHRGMGTHISRVKSVDLDAWTDEQLQSVLNWGNARANKYWEAKLAQGHVPSESKIENFIRTKYELKRWVMDGPMPDPSTLDAEGDDDVPLSVVKEKQTLERNGSLRSQSSTPTAASRSVPAPIPAPAPVPDLIGADPIPVRASTTGPTASKVPPKAEPAPPKATSSNASLLGLDFFGTETAAPPRPASTTGTSGGTNQSRPDLKQSILSLYASAPRPQQQAAPSHSHSGSFSGMSGMSSPSMSQTQNAFSGLNDAFNSLSFNSQPSPKPAQTDAFASLGSFGSPRPSSQTSNNAFSGLSGGSFFDSKPATSSHQSKQSISSPLGFSSTPSPAPASKPAPASSALGDLFDFSTTATTTTAAPPSAAAPKPSSDFSSAFNLSKPAATTPAPAAATPTTPNPLASIATSNAWSDAGVWGSNEWASAPEPPKPAAPEPPKPAPVTSIPLSNDFGWGNSTTTTSTTGGSFASQPIVPSASGGFAPAPKVAADEEFGGWMSSTTTPAAPSGSKPATGFGGSDDLFSNVWQ